MQPEQIDGSVGQVLDFCLCSSGCRHFEDVMARCLTDELDGVEEWRQLRVDHLLAAMRAAGLTMTPP